MAPDDVIWSNLGMNPYEARVRIAISWAATGALIVFWAFPVAFVGSVSNIYTLCGTVKWLTCDFYSPCNQPRTEGRLRQSAGRLRESGRQTQRKVKI